jgi:hypothetical protein
MRSITDLKQRAHFGVGAAMSLGLDPGDFAFKVRAESIPAPRASSRPDAASPRRSQGAPTCPTGSPRRSKGRKAVQEIAAKKVDIVKIWVDDRDRQVHEAVAALYSAVIDEAHKNKLRVTGAHLCARGREGAAQGRHRQRSRTAFRDTDATLK